MKIMIAFPPLSGRGFPMVRQARQFQWVSIPSHIFPVILACAATLLKEHGHKVIWNDCLLDGISYDEFLNSVKEESPDIIAIETKVPVLKRHWQVIDDLKRVVNNLKCKVVLMGDHVSAFPEESLQHCLADYIITGGDYDLSLLRLTNYLDGKEGLPGGVWFKEDGIIKNSGAPDLTFDLNNLPFIDRDLTQFHRYGEKWKRLTPFAYIMAGRDCWYGKCLFCSWKNLYPNFRVRKPENVLDEIGLLISKYNVREVFDDTGTFPGGEWLVQFCDGMIKRGYNKKILFSCNMRFDQLTPALSKLMKSAGFRKLKLGLESANQKTLDRLGKGITVDEIIRGCKSASDAGLEAHLTIMFGYPWETKKEELNTLRLARHLMNNGYAHMLQATILVPYPGTPLYSECLKMGWFNIDPLDYDRYDMSLAILKTPDMSAKEVREMCNKAYRLFIAPRYIFSQLKKLRSLSDIGYAFKGLGAVFGHIGDFSKKNGKTKYIRNQDK